MLEGITVGFIYSLTLFPGTVWLVKVGLRGSLGQVAAVAFGFWLSHALWLLVAIPGLMMMVAQLSFIRFGMHLFAAIVLGYMAYKFFRSPRVTRIDDAPELPSPARLWSNALRQSLAMPMRLPAAMAILLATGVYVNHPPVLGTVPMVLLGAAIGLSWWWLQFATLAFVFVRRVPQPVTVRSLNKIRPFSALLCLGLALISLLLGS